MYNTSCHLAFHKWCSLSCLSFPRARRESFSVGRGGAFYGGVGSRVFMSKAGRILKDLIVSTVFKKMCGDG